MMVIKQSVFDKWDIEDKSVQAVITSPPYYALRKYDIPDIIIGGDKDCVHIWGGAIIDTYTCLTCGAWRGQYGLEPAFELYLVHSMLWMKEATRVVKDNGIIFVNLADSFASSGGASRHKGYADPKNPNNSRGTFDEPTAYPQGNTKPKSKCLIPERFAIKCVDELGLILRNHIVWSKPNGMPESVTDRFSKKWESVFMFVKKPDYYFNLDSVREPHAEATRQRVMYPTGMNQKYKDNDIGQPKGTFEHILEKGKNPGDVWNIPTQHSPEKHFAMWPEKLVERMILCSTKVGDTVLDPFCGSGTTLRVADKLNRIGQGIDLGYEDIQARRLTEIQKELILEHAL